MPDITWHHREDSSDLSVINSTALHDEYGIHDLPPLSGWALDIGAHIGSVTIPLALDHPDLKVIAVEALPANCDYLQQNVEANGLRDRVIVKCAAIASENGLATVYSEYTEATGLTADYLHANRYIGNVVRTVNHPEWSGKHETVEALTLSTLLEDYDISEVAFAKTDCEGGEWALLEDPAVGSLRYIVGEYHDRNEDALFSVLAATHEVSTFPAGEGIGLFRAVTR